MKREKDAFTAAITEDTLVLHGIVTYNENNGRYGVGDEGMSFGARFNIKTDGVASCDNTSIHIKNATYVIIYGAFETTYDVNKFDFSNDIDYRKKLVKDIASVKD